MGDWDAFYAILLSILKKSRHDKMNSNFSFFNEKKKFEGTNLKKFFSRRPIFGWYISPYDIIFRILKNHPSNPCQTEDISIKVSLIGFSDKIKAYVKKKQHFFLEDENENLLHRKVAYPPIEQFVWSEFSIKAFKKSVVFIWH